MKPARAASFAGLAFLAFSAPARADLNDDASRLASVWQQHGSVRRLAPRFAERGSPSLVFAPASPPNGRRQRCLTLAIVGPSSTHFVVRALGPNAAGDGATSLASLAGLVELTRCGHERASLSAVLIEMRSPRAVLETLAVESQAPLPPAISVLPQRDPGPIEPLAIAEPPPAPPPLATRRTTAEARLRRDGAREITSESLSLDRDGTDVVLRTLSPGCHRFELLAESGAAGDNAELDVLPRLDGPARLVAIERGDGLQAAVEVCAGAEAQLGLAFGGAPGADAVLMHARWPLPDGLPEAWGHLARAGVATILRRHTARVGAFPVDHALGIQGPTLLPVRVEPGACYVAVVTTLGGRAAGLSLAARAPGVSAQNHAGSEGDGTLVSFCVRAGTRALIETDSRGHGLVWLFALFQTGRIELGLGSDA